MFSASAGRGFESAFPPTLTVRLKFCTNAVSTEPGCRTWQPVPTIIKSRMTPDTGLATRLERLTIPLLHHNRHLHVAVIGSTEVIADRRERSRRLGRDRNVGRMSRLDLGINFQFAHKEPVSHVFAMQSERHGLALLERDLIRCKPKTLGGDLNHPRAPACMNGMPDHPRQTDHQQRRSRRHC